MRLSVTDPADRDIGELHHYGSKTFGERRADQYVLALLEELDWIATWPLTSREHDEIRPPVRLRPFGVQNIIYRVLEDEVEILRVLHHSVNWIDLL